MHCPSLALNNITLQYNKNDNSKVLIYNDNSLFFYIELRVPNIVRFSHFKPISGWINQKPFSYTPKAELT